MEIKYILGAILFVAFIIGIIMQMILYTNGWHLFKYGTNPFKRTCKKCGAISNFIELNGRPQSYFYWGVVKALLKFKILC